jgi:ABC-type antimicrobial peptide transport system permease subunit
LPYGAGLLFEAIRGGVGSLAFLAGASISAGVVLSLLAALYPAATAARMVPADALRSNV